MNAWREYWYLLAKPFDQNWRVGSPTNSYSHSGFASIWLQFNPSDWHLALRGFSEARWLVRGTIFFALSSMQYKKPDTVPSEAYRPFYTAPIMTTRRVSQKYRCRKLVIGRFVMLGGVRLADLAGHGLCVCMPWLSWANTSPGPANWLTLNHFPTFPSTQRIPT